MLKVMLPLQKRTDTGEQLTVLPTHEPPGVPCALVGPRESRIILLAPERFWCGWENPWFLGSTVSWDEGGRSPKLPGCLSRLPT